MTSPSSTRRTLRSRLPRPVKEAARRALSRVLPDDGEPDVAPALSIVVPAFNVEDYIGECLESLLGQTFRNLEVIVVDDGSTDATFDVVNRYAADDARIRVLRQANSGQGLARNVGVEYARGEFLAFVDADDTVPKKAFAHMVKTLRRTGSDFCVGSTQRFQNGRFTDTAWAKTVHIRDVEHTTIEDFPLAMHDIIACNRLFRTNFWRHEVGGFRGHTAYEDHVPMLTAYVRATGFDILSTTTYNWRKREDQTSTSQQKAQLRNLLDRIGVKEEAHHLLLHEAPPSVYATWVARALEVDLPAFVQPAQSGSAMYRAILAAAYRTFLARATPAALAEVRFVQKTRAWLVSEERWADLDEAERFFREVRSLPPTVVQNGRLLAQVPDFLERMPTPLRELSPVETRFDGALEHVHWRDDGLLELTGWAFIRSMDMPLGGGVSAWLEHSDAEPHERVGLSVEPLPSVDPSVWGNDLNARYDGGAFRILVDPWGLSSGRWQLRLEVTQQGVTRFGSLHQPVQGSSAEFKTNLTVVDHGAARRASAGFHREAGFVIDLEPAPLVLLSADAGNGSASGTVLVAPGVNLQGLRLQAGTDVHAAALSLPNGHKVDFRFGGLPDDIDARLVGRTDDVESLPVALVSSASGEIDSALHWQTNPMGNARLCERAGHDPLVHSAQVVDGNLLVDLAVGGEPVQELHLGNKRFHVPALRLERVGAHTVRAEFPLETSILGGPASPIPSGNYRVRLDVAQPALHASQSLAHSAPIVMATPDLRLIGRTPPGKSVYFEVSAPLRPEERSPAGQKSLQVDYQQSSAPLMEAVFFQCYRGEFATDSQRALDEALRTVRPDLTRFWGVRDRSVAVPEGSVPLLLGSREWYDTLAASRYLCNNIDFDAFFRKRPGQRYLQTFHGYPFKSMGRGFWSGKGYGDERIAREIARRNAEYDAILVPSDRAAEFYRSEYGYTGNILVSGYPRSDFLVTADRNAVRAEVLQRLNVPLDSKVVLYAPTYRDNLTTRTFAARRFDELDLVELTRRLGSSYTVLVRGHNNNQRVNDRVHDVARVVDVTDYPEVNELTVAADAAILDYSSLRFDWALTGKPMVFFVPDLDTYFERRPPLFSFDESAPGPRLTTTDEVARALADLNGLQASQAEQIADFNHRFNRLHDGHATQRVIDAFFLE